MNQKLCEDCEYFRKDSLTGLFRREYFFERLKSKSENGYLVICDIDFFKKINDEFGHPIGDEVLRNFADNILSALKKDDLAARLGGEEFAVYLSGKDSRVPEFFQNLRNLSVNMKDIGRITFSMGAHILLKDIRLSYSCADNALLFSKKNGRDCYHFFDEIRSHNSCTRKIKREDSRNRSIWLVFAGFYDCDQVLHDKGRNFHRKRMGELKKDITRHLTGNESFYYKDALCITFTDLKKDQVEEIFRRIMEKFTGLNIIINSFPGITGLPHLFSDSWEAFLCHDLYSTKGRLSWFREDTYGIIGVRYFRRRRYNKAYIFFRRAYILNPVKENILNLCSCMIYLGKYISAEILLKRNSLEDTEHYYIDLSHILYKTQRLTEALELLKKGKRLYPDSGIIKNNYRELTCLLKD